MYFGSPDCSAKQAGGRDFWTLPIALKSLIFVARGPQLSHRRNPWVIHLHR
jgi:hypothetical protein